MSARAPDPAEAPPDSGQVLDFPSLGSEENPFSARNSLALSTILTEFYIDVRFNVRTRRTEWEGLGVLDRDDTWVAMSDRKLAELRERIARQYWVRGSNGPKALSWGREAFHDTLNALVYHRERDPFAGYHERRKRPAERPDRKSPIRAARTKRRSSQVCCGGQKLCMAKACRWPGAIRQLGISEAVSHR